MNIYGGLLFLHGHVASAELARQLVDVRSGAPGVSRTAGARETAQEVSRPPQASEDAPCVS